MMKPHDDKDSVRRRVQLVWAATLLVTGGLALPLIPFADNYNGLIGVIGGSIAVTGGFVASVYLVVQAARYRLLGFRSLRDITFSFVILGSGVYLVSGTWIILALAIR